MQKTTSRQLVNRQLQAFQENWGQVDLAYAKSKNLTPYDVLIIASIIEKEVIAPEERPLVAAVIYNRLHDGMNLGIDATTRYGLHVPRTEPLLESQLNSTNPYNTRNPNIKGLPPTPIANPGLASMQAAAHPAKVDYLYFVRKPDKVHHFFTASDDRVPRRTRTPTASGDHGNDPARRAARASRLGLVVAARCRTLPSRSASSTGPTSRVTLRRSCSSPRCAGSSRPGSPART